MPEQQIFEFRGVDNFYFAEVIKDDPTGYTCGTPVHIPVQEIGKSTNSSNEAHYYDNKAMIVVNSESADTITLVVAPPELEKLAQLLGKSFDATTGMMVDSPRSNKYYAIMYRTKGTDGGYRYVTRLKGQFAIPEETNATENDGTDTNNTTLTFTGIYTEYEFTKGKFNGTSWEKSGAKGIVVDARYGLANLATFFSSVQTPDTIQASSSTVTGIGVAPSTATVAVDGTVQLNATLTPAGSTGTITWTTSDSDKATVVDGLVTGKATGSATITATCGGYSDTCTVVIS